MKRRVGFCSSLVVILFAVSFFFSSATLAADPSKPGKSLTLRWSDMSPASGLRPEYLKKAAAEIEKVTQGRVKIEFYWSNSLVKVKENVRAVQKGIADMAWASATYHPAEFPLGLASQCVLYAPHGDDAEFITKRYWETWDDYKPFRDQTKKWGITVWYMFPYDSYGLYAKKPINKLEDFKGMRLRVSSEGIGKMVTAVGAHPGFSAASEVYTALEKGMFDGAICGYEWGKRYSFYEVTKYLNLINACMIGCGYGIVSKTALAKMSAPDRKAFMEIGRKVSLEYAKAVKEHRAGDIQAMKEKGMTLLEFHKTEREKWAQLPAVKALIPEWLEAEKKAGRGEDARGMMKLFLDKFELSHMMPK